MNKIFIFPLVFVTMLSLSCTNSSRGGIDSVSPDSASDKKAELVFKEYEHDFGKVSEGEKIAYVFTFENNGASDLVIKAAATSCGCTVPKYDSKPIAPGKGGDLEVVFDTSRREGMQTKIIKVKSNASVPVVLLKITAEVVTNKNQ